jgi:group I intron endonuclease
MIKLLIFRVLIGLFILYLICNLILIPNYSFMAAVATKYQTIPCRNPLRDSKGLRIGTLLSRSGEGYPVIFTYNGKRTMSTTPKPVPVRIYLNADKEKEYIVNENKGRTGIYRWVHIESGKSYVGSARNLSIRFKQYFNYNHIAYPKRNMTIYKALLKYGYAGFRLEILEYCDISVLTARLQFYVDKYKPLYNTCVVGRPKVITTKNPIDILGSPQRGRAGLPLLQRSWGGAGKYFHTERKLSRPIIPIMSYINALTQKQAILRENKDKSGVYRWINQETGESYIGSAGNLSKRLRVYYSPSGIEKILTISISRIFRALQKYGYHKFRLEILEYCDSDKCLEREQYYLDSINPEYNILRKAGSPLGYKHSAETIAKISLALKKEKHPMFGKKHSEETLALMSRIKLGKKFSKETLAKLSEAKKGEKHYMFGKKHSEETLKKMSVSHMGQTKPEGSGKAPIKIEVIDIKNNKTTIYDSISAAALDLNIGQPTISKYLARKDHKFYKKQFSFKKVS